jgi:hypothetical protein
VVVVVWYHTMVPYHLLPPQFKSPHLTHTRSPHRTCLEQEERERIREKIQQGETPQDYTDSVHEALKRVHGKQSAAEFQAVASTIAKRWKNLPSDERSKYEKLAESEMEEYQEKKFAYHRALVRDCADAAKTSILEKADSTSSAAQQQQQSQDRSPPTGMLPSWNMSLSGAMLPAVGVYPPNGAFLHPLQAGILPTSISPVLLNNATSAQVADVALSNAILMSELQRRRQLQDESIAAQRNFDLARIYDSELTASLLQRQQQSVFPGRVGAGGGEAFPAGVASVALTGHGPNGNVDARLLALLRQQQQELQQQQQQRQGEQEGGPSQP